MQPLMTPEPRSTSFQPLGLQSTIIGGSTSASLTIPLVIDRSTSAFTSTMANLAVSTRFLALHATSNQFLQLTMLPTYQPVSALDIWAPIYTRLPSMVGLIYQPLPPINICHQPALHATSDGGPTPPITNSIGLFSLVNT